MKEMASDAMKKKYAEGPNAVVVFGPTGQPSMGKHLGLWFLWSLIISIVAAYLASRLIPVHHARGAAKLVGAVTFIAHGFGTIQETIWMYRSWKSSATYLLDAALYGVGSAAVFYWLWP